MPPLWILILVVYFGALFIVGFTAHTRFVLAYHRRYHRLTGWRLFLAWYLRVPWRAPDRPSDLFRELDDPYVERLRRRARWAWRAWFISVALALPVGFLLFLLFSYR